MSILLYKVVSIFLSVAKDLANRLTDMVLIYSEASNRSFDGFRLFYLYTFKVWVWFYAIFMPFFISLNIEPLDSRGAAASLI